MDDPDQQLLLELLVGGERPQAPYGHLDGGSSMAPTTSMLHMASPIGIFAP